MHRTVTNTILSILLVALILVVLPANAFAASASASVSSSTVKPGDTVTVTVTFRGTDIGVVDGTFSYDPSILQYIGGSGTSGGGGSGLIKLVTSAPNSSPAGHTPQESNDSYGYTPVAQKQRAQGPQKCTHPRYHAFFKKVFSSVIICTGIGSMPFFSAM